MLFSNQKPNEMEIRWGIGTYFAFVIIQVDALSPSASLLSHNTSHSVLTPTGHFIQPTEQTRQCSFSVCWLHSPPYLMKDDKTGQITGTFQDAIEDFLSKCCKGSEGNTSSRLNFTHQVKNASELTECMKSGFDFVFPVLRSQVESDAYYEMRFQDLIRSPGIAVVKNRKVLEQWAKANVIQEFSQIWTVLVLAVLLNAIFGILIWVLVSRIVF